MSDQVFACENVNVRYGAVHAVQDARLTISAAESIALLGANGAGKSSLLGALIGAHKKATGSVRLLGKEVSSLGPEKRVRQGLAIVPEGRRVIGSLSVADNLTLGAYWVDKKRHAALSERVWAIFPRLFERRDQLAGTLSGGEQQMLAIGRALMGEPRVILMDEPTMGLAPAVVDIVLEKIRDVLGVEGVAILLAEQNARAALEVCSRGYLMRQGRLVRQGAAGELRSLDTLTDIYLR